MDGKIIIGTGLDTKGLEKDLVKMKKELENYAKEDEKLTNKKLNLEIDTERALDDLKNLDDKVELLQKKLQNIEARKGEIVYWKQNDSNPEWAKLNEEYDKAKAKIDEITRKEEDIVATRERQLKQINDINKTLQENAVEEDLIKTNIEDTTNKLNIAKKLDFGSMFKDMNNSLEKIGKKVSRMGLRLLGINSIYGMISQSVKRVQNDNPQFATFMQAIQNMLDVVISKLMTMIEPFLPKLLPLIEKVLTLIFEIVEALDSSLGPVLDSIIDAISWIVDAFGWIIDGLLSLLGIDISTQTEKFAKDINEASKGIKKTNKEVSKLRKQLLGFDEMNILNKDTGSVGALGNAIIGGSTTKPKDNKDWMAYGDDFVTSITVGAGAIADDMLEMFYSKEMKELEKIIEDAIYYGRIKEENGIVKIITATGQAIQFTKEEYDLLVEDIVKGKIPASHKSLWEKAKSILQAKDVKHFLKTLNSASKFAQEGLKDAVVTYKDGMVELKLSTGEVITFTEDEWERLKEKLLKEGKETKDEIVKYIDEISGATNSNNNGILDGLQSDIDRWKKNFKENIKDATYTYKNGMYEIKLANGETLKLNEDQWKSFQAYLKLNNMQIVQDNKSTNKDLKQNAKDGVKDVEDEYGTLPDWMKDNVIVELLKDFGLLGEGAGKDFGEALKKVVNKIIDKLETQINSIMSATWRILPIKLGNPPKINLKQFKLAKGGIINRVGSGVPVGNAIAGERGREAILPLTDSQQMALLGREIAKNVIINLTNVTELDGRQIARSVTQVMNDMNFASNGGVI